MKCKKIQELIMTDYLDGEVDQNTAQYIEQHLKTCQRCQEIEERVRGAAVNPFKNTQRLQPPQSLWQNIRDEIIAQKEPEKTFFSDIKDTIRTLLLTRRPALVMAGALITIVITLGILQRPPTTKEVVETYFDEQINAYTYLQNVNGDLNGDRIDFGTALEEYFL